MVTMTNKEKVLKKAGELGMELGCYSESIDDMTQSQLKKVLDNMEYEADTDVSIKRKKHVVQISIVDFKDRQEIDLLAITKDEFISRYGNERYLD